MLTRIETYIFVPRPANGVAVSGIAGRAKQLGLPTLAQAAALILALLALTQPLWSITGAETSADRDTTDYVWGTRTTYEVRGGTLDKVIFQSFTGPSFRDFKMREVVTIGFFLVSAMAAALFVAIVVPWVSRTPLPVLTVILAAAAAVLGFAATLYPVLTVADAYRTDHPGDIFVAGFAGQAPPTKGVTWTWGPGGAWYLAAAGLALAALATIVILLRFSLPRHPRP